MQWHNHPSYTMRTPPSRFARASHLTNKQTTYVSHKHFLSTIGLSGARSITIIHDHYTYARIMPLPTTHTYQVEDGKVKTRYGPIERSKQRKTSGQELL